MHYRQPRKTTRTIIFLFSMLSITACGINNIPTYDEVVNSRWAGIQKQYKRRADLVQPLMITIQLFAPTQADVLNDIANASTKISETDLSPAILMDTEVFKEYRQNQYDLSLALERLMMAVEPYPDLQSNEKFLKLQEQLVDTENRITVAHRDYSLAVQQYNSELITIPGRWWASFMYPSMQAKVNYSLPDSD